MRRVASLSDLPPGSRLAATVEGHEIVLLNIEGAVYAIADRCPHAFAPLRDGALCGTRLTCVWHGWTFELDPARRAAFVGAPQVTRYDVKVEAGEIYVAIPTSRRSSSGRSIQ